MRQHSQARGQARGEDHGDEADITDLLVTNRREGGRIQRRWNRHGRRLEGSRSSAHRRVPEKANGPPVAGH